MSWSPGESSAFLERFSVQSAMATQRLELMDMGLKFMRT